VGKGSPGAEPCIDLDAMLDLTANAQVDGIKFDGVDLFLFDPHISINIDDEGIKRLAEKIQAKGFVIGSLVAPVWPPTGGGSAMDIGIPGRYGPHTPLHSRLQCSRRCHSAAGLGLV